MDITEIDQARKEIHDFLKDIIEQKKQKTHGVKPAAFLIECSECKKMKKKAFMIYDYKNKNFKCYDCFIKKRNII